MENTEAWIDPKIVHLAFYKTKHQHTCTSLILNIYISWNYVSWREKKSLLVFQQTCKTSIEQQSPGELLCVCTRSVTVPTTAVNIRFCTTVEGYCKPRITVYGRRNWNDVLQNNKFECVITDFYRHKISSDTTQIPAESRPQPANNCREAKICLWQHE